MKVCILHKYSITDYELDNVFLKRAIQAGLPEDTEFSTMQLYSGNKKKLPKSEQVLWINDVQNTLNSFDYLLVTDGDYYKTFTKAKKAEGNIGLILSSELVKPKILYMPSIYAYNLDSERVGTNILRTMETLSMDVLGTYKEIGSDIIHSEYYPKTATDIIDSLNQLKEYPRLAVDIEARSLKLDTAGVYTISFAWDQHNGIAFAVDASDQPSVIKRALKYFFMEYQGKLIMHKANYDAMMLIFNLFQEGDITNIKAQKQGLDCIFRDLEDTLIITYLATNSCAGNTLGLKELAQPFAGNWAVDVSDVTKVNLDDLLRYNLIDCLATNYVYDTYFPKMVEEDQDQLYYNFMLPTLKNNVRVQLNGLPIDLDQVSLFKQNLEKEQQEILTYLKSTKEVINAEQTLAEKTTELRNSKLKTKVTTVQDNYKPLNFNSGNQLQVLLFDVMGLPIIETTETKQPSTSGDTLLKLINHTNNSEHQKILKSIKELGDVEKILSAFIPAFEQAHVDKLGNAHLLGYFNLAGTVSGRLSSSSINLQQLPATGSRFAKATKACFRSTDEWIFVGIDFNALEARIAAVTTKDPQRKKVFTQGYDVHCLNAYYMLNSRLPKDLTESVEDVNSIKNNFPDVRQAAKPCGFLLQYGGTDKGLEKNLGFSPEEAREIYTNYRKLYVHTIKWTEEHIKQACIDGYITTGLGLRVRTPVLKNTIYSDNMSSVASAEARTAGNALGQGWGVLNDRALNEVINKIDLAGLTEDILPVGKIHDACYYLVRNDVTLIKWLNDAVVAASKWQDHPVIADDEVHLSGQLDIFYPDWAHAITLPESCSEDEIIQLYEESTNE